MGREMDVVGGTFTRNWFRNRNLPTFREKIKPRFGSIATVYLELGVFEGMSMRWMLQHVLTSQNSFSVGVDPWLMTTKLSGEFMESARRRAADNTKEYQNCILQRGSSAEVLRKMCGRGGFLGISKESVDLCMVDGNHNALAVLDDLRHVHQLVKPGGWILLDDVENDIPKKDHVKEGLQMWLDEGAKVNQVWKHKYCECYEKS